MDLQIGVVAGNAEWHTRNGRERENTIALIINHFMKALMTCWMQTYKAETLVIDLFYKFEAFNCRLIDLLQIVIPIAILGIFRKYLGRNDKF
jgi:hypothetical protein